MSGDVCRLWSVGSNDVAFAGAGRTTTGFPECVNLLLLLPATCEGPEQSSITEQFR